MMLAEQQKNQSYIIYVIVVSTHKLTHTNISRVKKASPVTESHRLLASSDSFDGIYFLSNAEGRHLE